MNPGRVGILADDLTGASDTGLQFHQAGLRTWIHTRFPGRQDEIPAEVQVLSLNAGTRLLDPPSAFARVQEALYWLKQQGCRRFYHKIDSTLRGNLGAEIAGALAELSWDLAVVAPAYPAAGRQTVGGFQLVDGLPVGVSSYAADAVSPVSESYLPALLQRAGLPLGHLDLRTVLQGWEAIAAAIARFKAEGVRLISVDAARNEDLAAIAEAIRLSPFRILPVGSAGLAAALMPPSPPRLVSQPKGHLLSKTSPVLVVSGSLNPTTFAQLERLRGKARLVNVDARPILLTDEDETAKVAKEAIQGLLAQQDVVLTTALNAEKAAQDQALGRDLGLSPLQIGRRLTDALGRIVATLLEHQAVKDLVVIGGETASGVAQALPGDRLQVQEEVLPAIPRHQVVGHDLRLVTKSGGFGSPDALERILQHLHRASVADEPLRSS